MDKMAQIQWSCIHTGHTATGLQPRPYMAGWLPPWQCGGIASATHWCILPYCAVSIVSYMGRTEIAACPLASSGILRRVPRIHPGLGKRDRRCDRSCRVLNQIPLGMRQTTQGSPTDFLPCCEPFANAAGRILAVGPRIRHPRGPAEGQQGLPVRLAPVVSP